MNLQQSEVNGRATEEELGMVKEMENPGRMRFILGKGEKGGLQVQRYLGHDSKTGLLKIM